MSMLTDAPVVLGDQIGNRRKAPYLTLKHCFFNARSNAEGLLMYVINTRLQTPLGR
jgi:hypothetical protein